MLYANSNCATSVFKTHTKKEFYMQLSQLGKTSLFQSLDQ